jgi:hypothetical protein
VDRRPNSLAFEVECTHGYVFTGDLSRGLDVHTLTPAS